MAKRIRERERIAEIEARLHVMRGLPRLDRLSPDERAVFDAWTAECDRRLAMYKAGKPGAVYSAMIDGDLCLPALPDAIASRLWAPAPVLPPNATVEDWAEAWNGYRDA